jgi:hypothetical protein
MLPFKVEACSTGNEAVARTPDEDRLAADVVAPGYDRDAPLSDAIALTTEPRSLIRR